MSYKLVVKQRAKQQLADGIEWYELKQKGLGLKFLNQVGSYLKILNFTKLLCRPFLTPTKILRRSYSLNPIPRSRSRFALSP